MASRSRRANAFRPAERSARVTSGTRPARTITVFVPLPVSVARRVRTVHYPYPNQFQRRSRVVAIPLRKSKERFVWKRVKVRVPRRLPLVAASYVSVTDDEVRIHSNKQVRRLMRREFNRRRYEEYKSNERKARYGQLDSLRSDALGIVGAAARAGSSARTLGDAALVSRGLTGGW